MSKSTSLDWPKSHMMGRKMAFKDIQGESGQEYKRQFTLTLSGTVSLFNTCFVGKTGTKSLFNTCFVGKTGTKSRTPGASTDCHTQHQRVRSVQNDIPSPFVIFIRNATLKLGTILICINSNEFFFNLKVQ